MSIFRKDLNIEKMKADSIIAWVSDLYSAQFNKTDDLEAYILQRDSIKEEMQKLIDMQKKTPRLFGKNTPVKAWRKMQDETPVCERKFVERHIIAIEKKILNYKTDCGKINNLNNMIDKFMYYAGEFQPETVDYFRELVAIHFNITL